jgi:hypothetical protein
MKGIIDWEAFGVEENRDDEELEELEDELGGGIPAGDILLDVVGDGLLSAADFATGDTSGMVFLVPSIVKNVVELHRSTEKGERLLQWTSSEGMNDEMALEMKEVMDDLIQDSIDFVQRVTEAVPSPGVDELASFLGGLGAVAMGPMYVKHFSTVYDDVVDKLPETVQVFLEWEDPVTGFSPAGVFSDAISVMGALAIAIGHYREGLEFERIYDREMPEELNPERGRTALERKIERKQQRHKRLLQRGELKDANELEAEIKQLQGQLLVAPSELEKDRLEIDGFELTDSDVGTGDGGPSVRHAPPPGPPPAPVIDRDPRPLELIPDAPQGPLPRSFDDPAPSAEPGPDPDRGGGGGGALALLLLGGAAVAGGVAWSRRRGRGTKRRR